MSVLADDFKDIVEPPSMLQRIEDVAFAIKDTLLTADGKLNARAFNVLTHVAAQGEVINYLYDTLEEWQLFDEVAGRGNYPDGAVWRRNDYALGVQAIGHPVLLVDGDANSDKSWARVHINPHLEPVEGFWGKFDRQNEIKPDVTEAEPAANHQGRGVAIGLDSDSRSERTKDKIRRNLELPYADRSPRLAR